MPDRLELEGFTDKAKRVLQDSELTNPKWVKADKRIPVSLIKHCEGIAFISICKAGLFFLSGNVGGGCVICKVPDPSHPRGWRWSGPVSVGCGGLGGGFVFGAEKIDSVIIFNTPGALRAFYSKDSKSAKQITLGGNASLAVGPVGRDIEAHVGGSNTGEVVAAYSYSKAQGLYIGGTLEGAFLSTRESDNKKYYGDEQATSNRILKGEVQIPLKAHSLIKELDDIVDGTGDYTKSKLEASSLYRSQAGGSKAMMPTSGGSAAETSSSGRKLLNRGLSSDPDLPSGWEALKTDGGETYYYNEKLEKTQWEKPEKPKPRPPPSRPSAVPRPPVARPASSRPVAPLAPTPEDMSVIQGASRPKVPPRAVPTLPPRAASARRSVAKYDYNATQADELSFSKGDLVRIDDKSDPSWWKGELHGKKGLVPSNYF